ncbi:Man1-Src1p-C-terminal domain-containing protein [Xylaria nigripes]|nr:Man1-Src1p-C-terminal domain-containing protein [Xylaria nigripes]
MSDSENIEYLQPGFDPKSLTIPRLRSILVAHNVPYSSSAKKAQLVEIFNEHIVPQSQKILDVRARAKRSSMGIVDANTVSNTGRPFDEREDLAPPRRVSTRRSRSPRKAPPKIKSEEPEIEASMPPPAPPSPSKRASRVASRQVQAEPVATIPDVAPVPEPVDNTISKRTHREVTPKLKTEESDGLLKHTFDVFTSDNPFQSGGSPAVVEPTPSRRRRTTGHNASRSLSKSDHGLANYQDHADHHEPDAYAGAGEPTPKPPKSARRKTPEVRYEPPQPRHEAPEVRYEPPAVRYEPQEVRYEAPTARFEPPAARYEAPAVRYESPAPPTPSTIEAGEEFTPQEQLELAAEEAVKNQTAMTTASLHGRQPIKANKTSKKTPFLMLLVTALGVYAGWYRQEKIAVGYCGAGRTVSSIPSAIEVPEWAQPVLPAEIAVPPAIIDALEPGCEPCPAHAYCYSDFTVRCEQDYILKPHPFALGGVVPLPPTCEPDGEKVRRVQAVADRAIEELRERAAKYECREPINEEGTLVDTPAIEELELKQIIGKKRSRKMSNQEFEDIWGPAIGEIKRREEVKVEVKEASDSDAVPDTFLSSASLARVSLTCAARRSIRLGLARYRFQISVMIALVLTAIYGRSRFISDRAAAAKVPALVEEVLDLLAQQKERGYEDDTEDPWLFLPNLRDVVLRSTHSLHQRERIWRRVIAVVEQNSNVRTSQREGRSGEVGRAWEWIGPTTGDNSGRRRKSGRISYMPDAQAEDAATPEEKPLLRKWEEPRPVY